MMVDLLNIELAKARQRVKRAELSLQRANEMLDKDCGVEEAKRDSEGCLRTLQPLTRPLKATFLPGAELLG